MIFSTSSDSTLKSDLGLFEDKKIKKQTIGLYTKSNCTIYFFSFNVISICRIEMLVKKNLKDSITII
jgi:hypothetical protein